MADDLKEHRKKYPEHEKLKRERHRSEIAHDFIEWLHEERGYFIAHWFNETQAASIPENIDQLLADFIGVDLNKIEEEKRAMLDEVRLLNSKAMR
jgi:hypothetical protein